MQEFELNLEWRHIISISNLAREISGVIGVSVIALHPVFFGESGDSKMMKRNWTKFEVDEKQQKLIYIEKFLGTPIAMRLSLISQADEEVEKSEALGDQLASMSSFGLTFLTISDSDLALDAICYSNYFGPTNDILSAVKSFYKSEIQSNVLKLVASSDLLGNPRRY